MLQMTQFQVDTLQLMRTFLEIADDRHQILCTG